ncbi:hypothetical protein K8Q94_00510 [Candidatus Nomurabacteria bacterium]|nr:hypothetical protein [Candidatus Nomurabacteria bacterium]
MNQEISPKQLEANRENGKKGGVKTDEGKAVSKYNAIKHGIFKESVTDYEQSFSQDIADRLNAQFQPVGVLEKILVDRIGVYYLKLYRVAKSEKEYMQSILNPRLVEVHDTMMEISFTETVVKNEGYTPVVGHEAVDKLSTTYLRYEIAIENRLYKALHELQRLQSVRKGEAVTPPIAVDVDINGDNENGFVL